jgi:hypothetical protein
VKAARDFLAGRLPEGSEYRLMTDKRFLLKQPKSEEVRHP